MSTIRRAVVVEDDPDISTLLRYTLSTAGFEVHEAATGREALALTRELEPELVTLDLGLPDVGGIEVCRQLRQITDAYVLMISAQDDEVDRLVAFEAGADDYVCKPFSPREVQARVAAMFRRPRQSVGPPPEDEASVLRHGGLVVDREAWVATLDGVELPLTRLEFDLLATLLTAPRRVWTREVLLSTVWGSEWGSDSHLVEVHVGNLRRKLGDDARSPRWITTVRGVGYRMVSPTE